MKLSQNLHLTLFLFPRWNQRWLTALKARSTQKTWFYSTDFLIYVALDGRDFCSAASCLAHRLGTGQHTCMCLWLLPTCSIGCAASRGCSELGVQPNAQKLPLLYQEFSLITLLPIPIWLICKGKKESNASNRICGWNNVMYRWSTVI